MCKKTHGGKRLGAGRHPSPNPKKPRSFAATEFVYNDLADEILSHVPEQSYLTISNALQWRLQYARVIALHNQIPGVMNYEW